MDFHQFLILLGDKGDDGEGRPGPQGSQGPPVRIMLSCHTKILFNIIVSIY